LTGHGKIKWCVGMKYIVDSNKMKQIDIYTMDVIGIPPLVLMERAAMELVAVMKQTIKKDDRILAVCGPGNNGADGVAAARILFLQGYKVAILLTFEREKCSREMQTQLAIADKLGIKIDNSIDIGEYNIIVDAIFGIGLSKPVTGRFAQVIDKINNGNHIVFSADIPSGISADSGKVLGTAVRADYTVTFGYLKQGLILYPGTLYSGNITVSDIGFPDIALKHVNPDTFYFTKEDLCRLPQRKSDGHKGTFGKVLIVAGSVGMAGAAYLSAKAAYRTGAGMVKVLTASKNRNIIQTLLPEALFASYDLDDDLKKNIDISAMDLHEYDIYFAEDNSEANSLEKDFTIGNISKEDLSEKFVSKENIFSAIKWADVVVIGPGLGISDKSRKLLYLAINAVKMQNKPVVIDADAINLLAGELDRSGLELKERIERLETFLPEYSVLTPHPTELSRLIGISVSDISDNLIDMADQYFYNSKLIYVLKNARTIVAGAGNKYINISGNNGMATAGSGDVLTGIIAALMAQGLKSYDAACLAVYIHGLAGDAAAKRLGVYSMMAGDIADSLREILQGHN